MMSVQHIELANLPMSKTEAEKRVSKLQEKFGGKTYMNLQFCCYPIGGSFNVAASGNAESKEELSNMVMAIFTESLMK